jgi:hypothetical protein
MLTMYAGRFSSSHWSKTKKLSEKVRWVVRSLLLYSHIYRSEARVSRLDLILGSSWPSA